MRDDNMETTAAVSDNVIFLPVHNGQLTRQLNYHYEMPVRHQSKGAILMTRKIDLSLLRKSVFDLEDFQISGFAACQLILFMKNACL
ncbi:hypothetical protein ACLF3G_23595 [Falsiroseomonas sp. HC035]|uniref:hypothetical protein n=1 Tax=Falsiroseomonas sp. HC035 TaxID=3390999 RepID=UPI003D322028